MTKTLCFLLLAGAFLAFPICDSANAIPIRGSGVIGVGDTIELTRAETFGSTSGGEFAVYNPHTPGSGLSEFILRTFCIEKNEHVNLGGAFYVESITDEARAGGVGGPSPDPISETTRWLYANYIRGDLDDYSYNSYQFTYDTDDSVNDLQRAFWREEEEITGLSAADGQWLINLASEKILAGTGTQGMNQVKVLNLRYTDANGSRAQDQLYAAPVPEPATMLLVGTGLIGLAGARRRMRK